MTKKIITGTAIVAALVLMFFLRTLTTYVFDLAIVAVTVLATLEMSKLISKMGRFNNVYVAATFPPLMYIGAILLLVFGQPLYIIVLYMVGTALLFALATFIWGIIMKKRTANEIKMRKQQISVTKFSFKKSFHTLVSMIYPTVFMFFFIFLNNIDKFTETAEAAENFGGLLLSTVILIFAFFVPIITDTFAYLVGTTFKGPKLAPKISPNKTISGAVGGLVWAVIGSVIYFLVISAIPEIYAALAGADIYMWHFIVIGAASSIVAIAGDIFESLLKRLAGVKDSGNILPGHGGILDRIDSYIFTVPVMFLAFVLLLI